MPLKNLEDRKKWTAEYYKRNRQKIIERVKKYADDFPDRVAESQKKTREKHREARNKKQIDAYHNKRANESDDIDARIFSLVRQARYRSKPLGFKFDDGLYELLSTDASDSCPVCRKKFNLGGRDPERGVKDSPTLDRIDNKRGYELDNVAVICYDCNSRKSDASITDVVAIVEYMLKFTDDDFAGAPPVQ